jgi:hypothetical protein
MIAAIACVVLMGALIAFGIARTIRVWVALKDLQALPNLVPIHRVKKSATKDRSR